ncbi:hypothetical protein HJC23_004607 [Cyclotella cryptica]|uniref:Tudor domain-containing protein n=1 Tax=Cyclotella cryptica TaxID=29204 RepID=A0ABD3QEG9_9STRA
MELLRKAENAVGGDIVPAALETKVRLFSLLSGDFRIPIEVFSNDGTCVDLELGVASNTVNLAQTTLPSTAQKPSKETGYLDDNDRNHMIVEAYPPLGTSRVEESTTNQDSVLPTLKNDQMGPFSSKATRLMKRNDLKASVVNPTKPTSTASNKAALNSLNICIAVQGAPSPQPQSTNALAAKDIDGNFSFSSSRRHSEQTKTFSETTGNEVGHIITVPNATPAAEGSSSDEKVKAVRVSSDVIEDNDDSVSDPISHTDLDALKPGSNVIIYHKSKYWNATIKKVGINELKENFTYTLTAINHQKGIGFEKTKLRTFCKKSSEF